LLTDLQRLQRRGTVFRVDAEKQLIFAEPPAWARWWAKLKGLF
jgi:hypothetical protein